MIQKNEGRQDRVLRAILGIILIFLGIFVLTQTAQIIAFVVAGILIVTALTGYCGLYTVLGINTCPAKKK